MNLHDLKYEVVGSIEGDIPVAACTDSGGAQIIVGGREHRIHLLSRDFITHEEAVKQAKLVVLNGLPQTNDYFDLKDDFEGFSAFASMMTTSQFRI